MAESRREVRQHPTVAIRFARGEDLDLLARIEDDADRLFVERFHPEVWGSALRGLVRAERPGFLLVASEGDEVVGFAHLVEEDGAHLEQVAVRRDAGHRGHGSALVRASLLQAGARGHATVTLHTYADVPWNAPFYAALGFVETGPAPDPVLEQYGRRVRMTASTGVLGPR
jgi:ribosomal protein S18 acetylase RimI-like enzyme